MRIGPDQLVTNDVALLRRMWGVRSPFRKGPFYEAVRFDPTKDNIISMRDPDLHACLRAKMAAGVSTNPLYARSSPAPSDLLTSPPLLS